MKRETGITETLILGGGTGAVQIKVVLTHPHRELPRFVAFTTEISNEPEGTLDIEISAEILERVAKAVADYRETIKWGTHVCADHGYFDDGSYTCPACKSEKDEAAVIKMVQP